jgi:hypothetical protein
VLLQVGGDSLRAFTTSINPNIRLGKWVYYTIFGALELLLSLVCVLAAPLSF